MELTTASAVVSFHSKLEDQAVNFYEEIAANKKYAEGREKFLSFIKENKRHKEIVLRAYREVITDAIEACHFGKLNDEDYTVDTKLTVNTSYREVLRMALEVEEKIHKFHVDAYEASRAFLSDFSQALRRVAKKKASRKTTLKKILETTNSPSL